MADEEVRSTRSRFLSKLQRSKSTKGEDVNKDVEDFLKPSTQKAALMRPRIDVATAQRWPEAQSVQTPDASSTVDAPQGINGMRKKRRRDGLVVTFVATAPEIMGEGGDDSPYPTIEISKMKERSKPAAIWKRRSYGEGMPYKAQETVDSRAAGSVNHGQEPKPLRRANTSHHEYQSVPMYRNEQSQHKQLTSGKHDATQRPDMATTRHTDNLLSQHDRKRSMMAVNEGMALRCASSIADFDDMNDDHDIDDDHDPPPHFGPRNELKNFSLPSKASKQPNALSAPPDSGIPRGAQVADDNIPPINPLEDPKYNERRAPRAQLSPHPPVAAAVAAQQPAAAENSGPNTPQQRYPGQAQYPSSPTQSYVKGMEPLVQPPNDTNSGVDVSSTQYTPYGGPLESSSSASLHKSPPHHIPASITNIPSTTIIDRSPLGQVRSQENLEPASATPDRSNRQFQAPGLSPAYPSATEAALDDFAARVAHMKGVFQLTAEKERPSDKTTPDAWLRAAYWWYLKGKMGLESELRQRAQSRQHDNRELLRQGHVDLAKAWWILLFPLQIYGQTEDSRSKPISADPLAGYADLLSSLQGLCLSLRRYGILPPPASLIQGQDTRVWLSDTQLLIDEHLPEIGRTISTLDALPLGDRNSQFCYSRFAISVELSDRQGSIDQNSTPCFLTIIRSKADYHTGFVIAGQDGSLTVKVSAVATSDHVVSWRDVSWSSSMSALTISLPEGLTLHASLQQSDYRSLGNMVEYTRNAIRTRQAGQHEILLYQAQLASLSYSTSSGPSAFPRDSIEHCQVLVFSARSQSGNTHRVVFITEPSVKILSCASQETENIGSCIQAGDAQSSPSLTMIFSKMREECRAVLTFHNAQDMLAFQEVARGAQAATQASAPAAPAAHFESRRHPEGTSPVAKEPLAQSGRQLCTVPLLSYGIRSAAEALQIDGTTTQSGLALQWRGLTVLDMRPSHHIADQESSDGREGLRIVSLHACGKFVDQLSLHKGEIALRVGSSLESSMIEVLREPQPGFDAAIDVHSCSPALASAVGKTVQIARQQSTIRTFKFTTLDSLHQFQAALTGFDVRYHGLAGSFAISRRMMVVPIHHKWTASNVRLQVVGNPQGSVVKILAFMDDFDHVDAMCFQVKSTDVFEKTKGDSKGKKWSVKLVDAKFSLPAKTGKKEDGIAVKARRLFVNLEGLEYAEEHDDITIGFDTEKDRDLFAQALPAATTVSRMMTLRRRI